MDIIQAIKIWRAISRTEKALKEAEMEKVKSGLKTTEFWLALLGAILPVLNQHLGLNIPIDAIMTIAGIIISYILGRSLVKRGGSNE